MSADDTFYEPAISPLTDLPETPPPELIQRSDSPYSTASTPPRRVLWDRWRDDRRRERLIPQRVEALEARWNNPPTFTHMEEVRKTAEVAAQLAKIIGIAKYDSDGIYDPDITYHMCCLKRHFEQVNQAAAHHSEAAWTYPIHLASQLHELLDLEPHKATVDIVIHKFKHLIKRDDEYVLTPNPDTISFTPRLQSSTYAHRLGTNRYDFITTYHTPSPITSPSPPSPGIPRSPSLITFSTPPEGTPSPIVFAANLIPAPTPRSPSYHVHSKVATPTLAMRLRSPMPPQMLFKGNPEDIGQGSHFYTHPGSPFRKNRLETHKNVCANIKDVNGRLLRAKYAHFVFDSEVPHA